MDLAWPARRGATRNQRPARRVAVRRLVLQDSRSFGCRLDREPAVERVVQLADRAVTLARRRLECEAVAYFNSAAAVCDDIGSLQGTDDQCDRGAADASEVRQFSMRHRNDIASHAVMDVQ